MLIRWKSKDKNSNSSSGSKKKRKGREGGKYKNFMQHSLNLTQMKLYDFF